MTAVVVLVGSYQQSAGIHLATPIFSGSIIFGVSATAHVLIGVNDVRRIRARTLADQRQKTAVNNRVIRHDLRHVAQFLIAAGNGLLRVNLPTKSSRSVSE